jgi:adenylate kinase family enzyme
VKDTFFMKLASLGPRICIVGPSNSGKSTLAEAIARKCALEPVHLDRLYHLPHTDWEPRPTQEFTALHDAAIAGARWVMDGNYSSCMPQRLRRATGVILLDISTPLSLLRYLRRTWFERDRRGALDGGRDSVKWAMIHHIAVVTPRNRRRYVEMIEGLDLPTVMLPSAAAIRRCYRRWELAR